MTVHIRTQEEIAARVKALEVDHDREGDHDDRRDRPARGDLRERGRAAARRRGRRARRGPTPSSRHRLLAERHRGLRRAGHRRAAGRGHGRRREHRHRAQRDHRARCARATRGRCSACRRTGTRTPSTARGSCASRGRCCARTSVSTSRTRSRSACGTPASEMRYWVLPQRPDRHRRARREGARRARHPRLDDRHRRRQGGLMGFRPDATELGDARRRVEALVAELPGGERSFDHPWELRAFAIAVAAYHEGQYEWSEFQLSLIDAIKQMGGRRRRRAVVVLRALAHGTGDRAGGQRRALRRRPRRGDQVGAGHAPATRATTRPTASRWRSTPRGGDQEVRIPLPGAQGSLPGRAWLRPRAGRDGGLPRTRGL